VPEICQFDIQKEAEDVRTVVGVLAVALRGCFRLGLRLGLALVCSVVCVFSVAARRWWVGACK
jgi:hypothetical protein